jgi:hypothetical protein
VPSIPQSGAYASSGVSGRTTFLEWAYEGTGVRIRAGADPNLIEGGKVVVRTIHCTAELLIGAFERRTHLSGARRTSERPPVRADRTRQEADRGTKGPGPVK